MAINPSAVRWTAGKIAAGLCYVCGKVPVTKYRRCLGCRQRNAAAMKAKRKGAA